MRERGFEIAKGWEDRHIELPRRSTTHAAAYDIAAATDITVPPFHPGIKPTLIPTGLKAYCQPDECYFVFNRSSGAGKGIVLANGVGVIDADYYANSDNDGHFQVLVFNVSDHELRVKKGDRIAQVIFQKFLTVDHDVAGGERLGGFGSTDGVHAGRNLMRIVYDLDDVLWDLTRPVMQSLGLSDRIQTDYRLANDEHFTKSEKQAVTSAFCDPQSFAQIEFYPGADQIFNFAAPDVEVVVNSNVFSEAVAAVKQRRLCAFYPQISPTLFQLNLVTPSHNHKQIDSDTLVFIDDSPYNIAASKAKFNLMPHKTWNTTAPMRKVATGENKILLSSWRRQLPKLLHDKKSYVVPVKDLSVANDFVQNVIKATREYQNGQK